MTRKQAMARRAVILKELSTMSRLGWHNAKPCDYEPLERELRRLEEWI